MAKKAKGKQKQEESQALGNADLQSPLVERTNVPTMVAFTEEFHDENSGPVAHGGTWGAVGGTWEVGTEPGGEPWVRPQETDAAWGHSESLLQPPPVIQHSILPTIPEQSSSGNIAQNRTTLSDIGESQDEFDTWSGDKRGMNSPQQWDMAQSQTVTATAAPSMMGSPNPVHPPSLNAAALEAAHAAVAKQKISSASDAARKLEQSRAQLYHERAMSAQFDTPAKAHEHLPQVPPPRQPMSSASAYASSMQPKRPPSTSGHVQSSQNKPNVYPKPFNKNGRPPAPIPVDPSWISTGGNAWSNKHRQGVASSSWTHAPAATWTQEAQQYHHAEQVRQAQQPQQPQRAHRRHHSTPAQPQRHHRPHAAQNQSWQDWGKENMAQSRGSEAESDDETVNDGVEGWGQPTDVWGQQPTESRKGGLKRDHGRSHGKKAGDWAQADGWGQNGAPVAWGQETDHGGQQGDNWQQGSSWGQAADGWDQNTGGNPGQKQTEGNWGQKQTEGNWGQKQTEGNWGQKQTEGDWGQSGGTWGQGSQGGGEAYGGQGDTAWGGQNADSAWDATGGGDWGGRDPQNAEWGGDPQRLPKVTSAPSEAVVGSRNVLSPQQRSQILNNLLKEPQTQNFTTGQHQAGAKQGLGNQNKKSNQEHRAVWEAHEQGWGSEDDYGQEMDDNRRVHFSPKASDLWGESPRSIPSKTLARAQQGLATTPVNDPAGARFLESKGAAFEFVTNAFFGNARLARERIHWLFPSNKDLRVAAMLAWVQKMSFNLGSFGLLKFLQHRERGGLFINTVFRMRNNPNEPALDWLTFNELQGTMDKTLQESVAFYDPSAHVMVFVYLPSESGNSIAIWRQKITVPDNAKVKLQGEINAVVKSLRNPKDYVVCVDELPPKKKTSQLRKGGVAGKANPKLAPPTKAKKNRKWWKFFLS